MLNRTKKIFTNNHRLFSSYVGKTGGFIIKDKLQQNARCGKYFVFYKVW